MQIFNFLFWSVSSDGAFWMQYKQKTIRFWTFVFISTGIAGECNTCTTCMVNEPSQVHVFLFLTFCVDYLDKYYLHWCFTDHLLCSCSETITIVRFLCINIYLYMHVNVSTWKMFSVYKFFSMCNERLFMNNLATVELP